MFCAFGDWLGCATRHERSLRLADQESGIIVGVRYLPPQLVWTVDKIYYPVSFTFDIDDGLFQGHLDYRPAQARRPVFVPVPPGRHRLIERDPPELQLRDTDFLERTRWRPLELTIDVRSNEVVSVLVTPARSRLIVLPGYVRPTARVRSSTGMHKG